MEIIKLELDYLEKPRGKCDRPKEPEVYTCFKFDVSKNDAPSWAKVGMRIERHGIDILYGYMIIHTFVWMDGYTPYFIAVVGLESDILKPEVEKLKFTINQI